MLGFVALLLGTLNAGPCPDEPSGECGVVIDVNDVTKGVISVSVNNLHPDASYLIGVAGTEYVGQAERGNTFIFSGLPSGSYPVTWYVSGCPDANSTTRQIPGPNHITIL